MGATNCPETPRQKMIQMMYLVYTAMLALNVSADILQAFVVVNDTLVTSTQNANLQNAGDYQWLLGQKTILGDAKVGPVYNKAMLLKKESDSMVKYIEDLRADLIYYVDGDTIAVVKTDDGKTVKQMKTVATIDHKDNFDKPTDYLINKGYGEKLQKRILEYKSSILKLTDPKDRERLATGVGLNVDTKFKKEGAVQDWAEHNFDHIITAASVTLLNKTIGEVRNAESLMLAYLKSSISANDFKFDHVGGRAIPRSQMVFSGGSYDADIIVAAYDTKVNPEVYYKMGADTLTEAGIGGATHLVGENGVVKLKIGTGGTGDQRYAGLIKVIDPNGQPKYYGFKDKYTVLKPSATIAADKMNVLYAGIPNPVSVSAPVDAGKLNVSFPGCGVSKAGNGQYNVSVPASLIGKTINATVVASLDKSSKAMGGTVFRVKRVPDPRAVIGANIRGGKHAKAELLANPFIRANMGTDFVYDLKWNVTSFRVTFTSKGYEDPAMACSGGAFSDAVRAKIQNASSNTVITFSDIKVSSPAGARTLDEIAVRIR